MAAFKSGRLFCTSWMLVRHRSKPNIQKPRIPHRDRLLVMETMKPVFDPVPVSLVEQCEYVVKGNVDREMSTYERLLGIELLQFLDGHPMVAFYHANSVHSRSEVATTKLFLRNNMFVRICNRFVVEKTLKGTRYEAILPLFQSHTKMVFSKEQRVDLLLKFQRKTPELILLAAIVENRILSKPELDLYGSLPSLDVMRSQLCSVLNSAVVRTSQYLNHHQRQLSHSLKFLSEEHRQENDDETTS